MAGSWAGGTPWARLGVAACEHRGAQHSAKPQRQEPQRAVHLGGGLRGHLAGALAGGSTEQ